MMESGDKETASDSLTTVLSGGTLISIAKIFALGFGFLTQIVMARFLTEAAYGNVVLALAVVSIAGLVAKLGLDDGVMREYPHYEDSPAKTRGIVRSSIHITTITGLLTAGSVFLAAPVISRVIFNDSALVPLIHIASVGIIFNPVSDVAVSLAQGARDARVKAYVGQIIRPAARLLLVGGLLLAGFNAVGAISGQIFAIVIAALATFYLTGQSLPSFDISPVPMYRSVLAFSAPLIAVQGMGFLNNNIDIYMAGYFLQSASLGVYNIALQLGNIVTAILGTAGFLLPPVMTRLQQQEKNKEMRRTFQVLTKWMTVVILPVFVVLFFAPRLVISLLFGESYADGALALQILLIGKFISILVGLNTQGLIALGKNKIISYIVLWETAINAILNYILIPAIGIEGAAIGITVSTIIGDGLGVFILYREFRIHPFTISVLSPVLAVISIGLLGYGTLWFLDLPTYWTVPIVGISYLPLIIALAPEPEDNELLSRVEESTGYNLDLLREVVTTFR